MSITEKSGFQQSRRNWNSRLRAWQIDLYNRAMHGKTAPQFAELIWVSVQKIQYATKAGSSKQSGRVISHWPTHGFGPVDQTVAIKAYIAHWRDGVAWEDTGIYEAMMEQIHIHGKVDRLRTFADIKLRYQQLDALYTSIQKTGRLNTRRELVPGNFREEGGILINIGPEGAPYFGRKGNHRLALAIAAKLEFIPAQLGVVHIDGLPALPSYRETPLIRTKPWRNIPLSAF